MSNNSLDPDKLNDIFNIDPKSQDESQEEQKQPPSDDCPEIEIDIAKAYTELSDLIKTGKEILENSKYVIETNPEDSESVQAAASIINSLKDLTKEFTKIHAGHLQHQRHKELELLKLRGREEILNQKFKLSQKILQNNPNNPALPTSEEMIPFSQERLIEEIIEAQAKTIEPDTEE